MARVQHIKWFPHVIFLLLFAIQDGNADNTKRLELINATKNSLTFSMNLRCAGASTCPDSDRIIWIYSKAPFHYPTKPNLVEYINHDIVRLSYFSPGTRYNIRAGPQSLYEELSNTELHFKHPNITVIEASTCPETPNAVHEVNVNGTGTDFIKLWWYPPSWSCISTAYYIRWFEYDDVNHSWDKEFNGTCPTNAIFVANTSDVQCKDNPDAICYTIKENITASTQYVIEVTTTDSSGLCSASDDTFAKTLYDYWGGITIGSWCLIVICFILAIGAVPVVIRLKKRLALQISSKQNVIFKRSNITEDCLEDEERDPDVYLISNSTERNIEIQRPQ